MSKQAYILWHSFADLYKDHVFSRFSLYSLILREMTAVLLSSLPIALMRPASFSVWFFQTSQVCVSNDHCLLSFYPSFLDRLNYLAANQGTSDQGYNKPSHRIYDRQEGPLGQGHCAKSKPSDGRAMLYLEMMPLHIQNKFLLWAIASIHSNLLLKISKNHLKYSFS